MEYITQTITTVKYGDCLMEMAESLDQTQPGLLSKIQVAIQEQHRELLPSLDHKVYLF